MISLHRPPPFSPDLTSPIHTGKVLIEPIGWVCTAVSERGLSAVALTDDPGKFHLQLGKHGAALSTDNSPLVEQVLEQIAAYLRGRLRSFDLPIDWAQMAPFQEKVLRHTYDIPYGAVRTYGQLAGQIGSPKAARAVGGALARNPIAIVIPCHRVVGTDRRLHGFAAPGGITAKAWLLQLEGIRLDGQKLA